MDFQNTHSLKDYKEKISAFEKFFCKKKLCQYIAIFDFVQGGGGVLFYFIPEPNKDIVIFFICGPFIIPVIYERKRNPKDRNANIDGKNSAL